MSLVIEYKEEKIWNLLLVIEYKEETNMIWINVYLYYAMYIFLSEKSNLKKYKKFWGSLGFLCLPKCWNDESKILICYVYKERRKEKKYN